MAPSSRISISVFIVCSNEEDNIRRCLESVSWCDEIVVILDTKSADRTREYAERYTDKIIEHEWEGYVGQKRFGLSQCTKEWVLNLDADEEVSKELKESILNAIKQEDINGYELSRVVFYLGKWWRKGGWFPEYRLRLCRRVETTWGGADPHESASVNGTVKRLDGELRHYTYTSLRHHMNTVNNFSSQSAETMYKAGKRAWVGNIVLNPITRFLKFYIFKKGFLEGFRGLLVAIIESYGVFLKYAKLWELGREDL